ncbi:MAG: hypothetical protein KA020_12580, partial [Planctomycetes bacterium]|nr:hypothetical protein [Planctomycetota bacterium]
LPPIPWLILWSLCLVACASHAPLAAPGAGLSPALRPLVGDHRGLLHMHSRTGERVVAMGLLVEPLPDRDDAVRFVLSYGEGETLQVRDYLLVVEDAATGAGHIDERNGIVLAAQCVAGEVVCVFAVSGQCNVVRYRATPEGVDFALDAFAPAESVPTGSGVSTQPQVVVQRARLVRQR